MHDVFISYSSADKSTADAVCAALESAGVRCWVAPRDILAGTDWGEAIVAAIASARVMVLVFSASANTSPQVRREVERAVDREVTIVPFRIEPVEPAGSMEYYISTPHWLDALTPPVGQHLSRLTTTVRRLLAGPPPQAGAPAPAAAAMRVRPRTLIPVAPDEPGGTATRTLVVLGLVLAGLFVAAGLGFRQMILARNRPVTAGVTLEPQPVAPSSQPAATTAPAHPASPATARQTTTGPATAPATGPVVPGDTFAAAMGRGRVALSEADYPTAVDEFSAAIRFDPSSAEARVARANVQTTLSRPDLALADLTEAVRLDTASLDARMLRGNAHVALGQEKEALGDYAEAIRLDPRNPEAYLSRAAVYAKLNDAVRSRTDFETANRLMAEAEKQQ